MASVEELIQSALRRHQSGKLQEAEAIYKQILTRQPRNPNALFYLGLLNHQSGRHDEGVELMRQALRFAPDSDIFWMNLAVTLASLKRFEEAVEAYRGVLKVKPNLVDVHFKIAEILSHLCRFNEAIPHYLQATRLKPDFADAFNSMGNAYRQTAKLTEALACYKEAAQLQPRYPAALHNLASTTDQIGDIETAIKLFRQANSVSPQADAFYNLGIRLAEKGMWDDAITHLKQAISLQPSAVKSSNALINLLHQRGRAEEAIVVCQAALANDPHRSDVLVQLGITHLILGQIEASQSCFRQVEALRPGDYRAQIEIGSSLRIHGYFNEALARYCSAVAMKPDDAEAHLNLAMSLMLGGDFRKGMREYGWRFQILAAGPRPEQVEIPLWDGRSLAGQKILLYVEQGFGDTIQFVRFVPEVFHRGGRIILECQPELIDLMRGFRYFDQIEQIVPRGINVQADVRCPLMSLPLVLGTTIESIPVDLPYFTPDGSQISRWRDRLISAGTKGLLKVGIVWSGSAAHGNDANRSLNLQMLVPLQQVPGVQFVSLNRRDPMHPRLAGLPLNMIDWTSEFQSFADTAGLISNLDLVISVDTAVAHLAGAMGKPTWLLLPFAPDWRWLQDRVDSPWYPAMRLFRQPKYGDWQATIERVAEALHDCQRTRLASAK